MDFNFYSFAKKPNSTITPAEGSTVTTLSGYIKEPTTITAPVIELSNTNAAWNPTGFNYAYIPDFSRYYFVTNWGYNRGVWEATLAIDVLGSWKSNIGEASEYVTRSSAAYTGAIRDMLYPATSAVTISTVSIGAPYSVTFSTGCFIVGIVGSTVTYYAMSYSELYLLLSYLYSGDFIQALVGTNFWAQAFSALKIDANVTQFISSLYFMPIPFDDITGTSTNTIDVAGVTYTSTNEVTSIKLLNQNNYYVREYSATFPRHPLAASRGSFLNASPYSQYSIFFPGFGVCDIPADIAANISSISATIRIDYRTGIGFLDITYKNTSSGTIYVISRNSSQIATPISTANVVRQGISRADKTTFGYNVGAMGLSAIGSALDATGAGVYTAGAGILSAESKMISSIGDLAGQMLPVAQSTGSDGAIAGLVGAAYLQAEFQGIADEDNAQRGRPYCKIATISSLPGYIECADASIELPATYAERTAVINYMNSGFYYE